MKITTPRWGLALRSRTKGVYEKDEWSEEGVKRFICVRSEGLRVWAGGLPFCLGLRLRKKQFIVTQKWWYNHVWVCLRSIEMRSTSWYFVFPVPYSMSIGKNRKHLRPVPRLPTANRIQKIIMNQHYRQLWGGEDSGQKGKVLSVTPSGASRIK